ncbi:hypothetical protein N657DRAFT_638857 [Parathielavia appendiculata]|uniref:Uncharacterized protein n=1 Tax=Parathielavia appendiculata TaxID=2587402 RepID=A0AAN6Z7A3_9PEZI|nr:hypothetical protein N657DRAFT_638857 [Parathielavia appendiculata]
MNPQETEILVHIAAPARAADDAKYRALAAAYLSFNPATHTTVVLATPKDNQELCHTGENVQTQLFQTQDPPRSTPGVIQSPMLSFQSAANNFGSPRLQQPGEGNILESQSLWRPPPSVIQDSMPENEFVLPQYCTPTRILEHYTSGIAITPLNMSPLSQRRQTKPLPPSSSPKTGRGEMLTFDIGSRSPPPHEDQGTVIPLSPREAVERHRQITLTASAIVEETRIGSSYPSRQGAPASSSRAESEPPLSKRPRTSQNPAPGKPIIRSASDVGPQRRTIMDTASHDLPNTFEIISPPPLTDQRELQPEDMITDVLARLARELNLEKRFRPESQTRDLRPFERGYWLVDCTSWEPELKRSAWGFLTDYLGKGAAGWGTLCRRDADFSYLRLYCWGCVVGHMYLVLYLACKRRVMNTGTRWIGADGVAVVVMGPRPGPV